MKRETWKLPQTPLSISWLGEAKRAGKALKNAKARPSQAMAKAQKPEVKTSAAAKVPGARAKQQRRQQPGARAKVTQIAGVRDECE